MGNADRGKNVELVKAERKGVNMKHQNISKAVVVGGAVVGASAANAQLVAPTLTGAATNATPLLDATVSVGNFGIGAVILLATIGVVLAVGALVRKALRGRASSV